MPSLTHVPETLRTAIGAFPNTTAFPNTAIEWTAVNLESNAPPLASAATGLAVKVEGLCKSYGKAQILHSVDLQMRPGEVVSIIGPSGAGKSTFLRCLNYLEAPTEGTITIGDVTVSSTGKPDKASLRRLRRVTGMVFQSFNLFPHLTVLENVTLPQIKVLGRSRQEAEAASMDLLKRVGLESKASVHPSKCSGGQQQRIAIARALALSPEVMLFDERPWF
jgi:polar amino acid transport system ATP-binding protein